MIAEFCDFLPFGADYIIINAEEDLLILPHKEYLMITTNIKTATYYEVRGKYSSVFKQANLINNILAIGIFDKFYLYDTLKSRLILIYQCEQYFGSFKKDNNTFYVCDANGIACIREDGKLIWENKNLGIDGVVISSIDKIIKGKGEWDPPNGWIDFQVDSRTGLKNL